MRLTIRNRLRLCWEILTISSGHKHSAQEKQLSTFNRGYQAGRLLVETPKQSLAHIKADAVYEFAEAMDKERAEASNGDWMRNDEEQFYHECSMEAEKYANQLREGE